MLCINIQIMFGVMLTWLGGEGKKRRETRVPFGGRVRDTDTLQISKALSLSFFEFSKPRKFVFPQNLSSFSLK